MLPNTLVSDSCWLYKEASSFHYCSCSIASCTCTLYLHYISVLWLWTIYRLVEAHIFSFVVGRAFVTDVEKLKISSRTRSLHVVEVLNFFSEVTKVLLGLLPSTPHHHHQLHTTMFKFRIYYTIIFFYNKKLMFLFFCAGWLQSWFKFIVCSRSARHRGTIKIPYKLGDIVSA